MRYIFYELICRDGDHEYYYKTVAELSKRKSVDKFLKEQAKDFYEDEDGYWEDDEYYALNGCVATSVDSYREISKEHYEVLKQYI